MYLKVLIRNVVNASGLGTLMQNSGVSSMTEVPKGQYLQKATVGHFSDMFTRAQECLGWASLLFDKLSRMHLL
jgi:hypothetical protein